MKVAHQKLYIFHFSNPLIINFQEAPESPIPIPLQLFGTPECLPKFALHLVSGFVIAIYPGLFLKFHPVFEQFVVV